jgi:hypothetical protein
MLTMVNIEAGPAEKAISSNVRTTLATLDRGDVALHVENESISATPDGGYGWTIVVAIMFLNAVTWGTIARIKRRTPIDLRQGSTRRLESIYRTLRHSRPSQTLRHSCIRSSGVFLSLLLCYVHP